MKVKEYISRADQTKTNKIRCYNRRTRQFMKPMECKDAYIIGVKLSPVQGSKWLRDVRLEVFI